MNSPIIRSRITPYYEAINSSYLPHNRLLSLISNCPLNEESQTNTSVKKPILHCNRMKIFNVQSFFSQNEGSMLVEKPIRITLFFNGNRYVALKYLIVNLKQYKMLAEFLKELSYSIPTEISINRNIIRILTPRGRHRIYSVDELKDGGSYVCCGLEPFEPIKYLSDTVLHKSCKTIPATSISVMPRHLPANFIDGFENTLKCPSNWELPFPNDKNVESYYAAFDIKQTSNQSGGKHGETYTKDTDSSNHNTDMKCLSRLHACKRSGMALETESRKNYNGVRQLIVVRPSGSLKGYVSVKITINRKSFQTLGQVLYTISDAFGPAWSNDPLRNLYTVRGREVRSVTQLQQAQLLIGVGVHKLFSRPVLITSVTKPGNLSSRGIPLQGKDIHAILSEFWPNHPNPESVIEEWERRLARVWGTRSSWNLLNVDDRVEQDGRGSVKKIAVNSSRKLADITLMSSTARPKPKVNRKSNNRCNQLLECQVPDDQRDSGFHETILSVVQPDNEYKIYGDGVEVEDDGFHDGSQLPFEQQGNIKAHGYRIKANRRWNGLRSCLSERHCTNAVHVAMNCDAKVDQSKSAPYRGVTEKAGHRKPTRSRCNQTSEPVKPQIPDVSLILQHASNVPKVHPKLMLISQLNYSHAQDRVSDRLSNMTGLYKGLDLNSFRQIKKNPLVEETRNGHAKDANIRSTATNTLVGRENEDDRVESKATEQSVKEAKDRYGSTRPSPVVKKINLQDKIAAETGPRRQAQLEIGDKSVEDKLISVESHTNQPVLQKNCNNEVVNCHHLPSVNKGVGIEVARPSMHNGAVNGQLPVLEGSNMKKSVASVNKLISVELDQSPGDGLGQPHTGNGQCPIITKAETIKSSGLQISSQRGTETNEWINWNTDIKNVSDPEYLLKRYHIGRVLGDGNFAVVKQARLRKTGQHYAVKIIEKSKLKGKDVMLRNEIAILHACKHPNIVRLYEEFETSQEILLVMEFVKGGDLFDGITKSTKFDESTAAGIVSDLASALFYLHCRHVVHRDVKPENVLLWRQTDGRIRGKLADFGLALEVRRRIYTICGTPTYIAPEILIECGYGREVDMWALGVITYIMMCGFAPFRSSDRRQSKLFASIKRGVFVFLSPYWDEISAAAKDLVNSLLVVSVRHRLTALETLVHPWVFSQGTAHTLGTSGLGDSQFEIRRGTFRQQLTEEAANLRQHYRQSGRAGEISQLASEKPTNTLPPLAQTDTTMVTSRSRAQYSHGAANGVTTTVQTPNQDELAQHLPVIENGFLTGQVKKVSED